ncbi:MAG: helix-turn-helix transcriptional regulator [Planctomycetota bacterium]
MSRKRQPAATCPRSRLDLYTLACDFESGHRIGSHSHAEHQLVYASRGVMTVHTPDGSWVVPAHRGVWVPARTVHSIEISGAVSMRTLYLAPRIARSVAASCHALNVSPLLRELILHAVALGRMSRRNARHAQLIDLILDQLEAAQTSAFHLPQLKDPRARRIAQLLHNDPSDRRPLGMLTRGMGASKRTIERAFLADTGLTFGRWRQQLRLVHSLRLLAAGEKVTSVALAVGYDSLSAFVSAFRRAFGITPGRYFRSPARPR